MRFIDKTIKYLGYFTAFILAILVLLVVYDATARYLFSEGSTALQELEWHLFDLIILFAIAYTLRENAHVRVDIFYASFSDKKKALVNMISSLFFILPFSFLIIYIGIDFVSLSFVQNECSSNPGGLEYRFLVKSLMPLSFLFLSLQAAKDAKNNFDMWRAL
ncbi:MAG: C4-dicarboxylate ABC transporter [Sulfurimonas sp. RIFOXYD12_FULL_33_39]|uniref:TRAP transporter small permease subunit n=1 Tax=unclassified Sulfurimonas TaxID=2623549 RepID=UPI0008BA9D89|nr:MULTISPECIES: TRAP transporter small permease subunit [unclassified Sulfurimonas]OHE03781.1 MAG: C4-dicarboxylate ABC transporter [Sulfurimonas sp. RIFCSPLOWO2_12_FULL_34_6]OHE09484.1 MAG: C4-dicarboxylate ABC transporter [Sulfurimonas sp. RIFOXYD12_FULL_33_39]OHE12735.1 MAG: C4-dicarboxylate ABC transporter [Sulfurimonas sp. RIFOXYD2_FULL_34_21]DAB28577.1 MAG TPA: C4-dicarboxylate ABC transporter [Sulfurimonas sp. UBA10385]